MTTEDWASLPDEVQLAIFFFLPPTDVVRVAGVCQAWSLLSQDRTLWSYHYRSFFCVPATKQHQHKHKQHNYNHRAKCIPVLRWLGEWEKRYAHATADPGSECVQPTEGQVALLEEKLHWASEKGLAGIVAALLPSLRVPKSWERKQNANPLLAAIVAGHVDTAECFLTLTTAQGIPCWRAFLWQHALVVAALDLAVWNGRTEIASHLMKLAQDAYSRSRKPMPSLPDMPRLLAVAIEARQVETVRMLVNRTDYAPHLQDALAKAVATGIEEVVGILLLSKKMDQSTLAAGLRIACSRSQVHIIDMFLRFGVDPTSSEALSQTRSKQVAEYLLGKGADPNVGCPLARAARTNHVSVAQALLDRGAQPNQLDSAGYAPLHHAAIMGFENMTRLLLAHGADPALLTRHNRSALSLVREQMGYDDDMYTDMAALSAVEAMLLAHTTTM